VPEYARRYIEKLKRPYQESDLLEIARGQLIWEDEKASANPLFCDTNLIVIKIWSEHKYGHTDPWILDQLARRHYDYYLLTDIDLPWQDDPQREHPGLREYFFNVYRDYLEAHRHPFRVVSGTGEERLKAAVQALEEFLA
jgi:nicotinamide riboside kinase